MDSEGNKIELKRVIGLFDGINLILGTIIGKSMFFLSWFLHTFLLISFSSGSGIFITPAGILGEVKSVYMSLIIWLICGLVSILGFFFYVLIPLKILDLISIFKKEPFVLLN